MKTYISMLRGINVSGQKKILMVDLKALYEKIGFKEVVTYIQSGNVVFQASKSLTEVEIISMIQTAITEKYQFEVPVMIRLADEIAAIIENNPFLKQKDTDIERIYVAFLSEKPSEVYLEKVHTFDFSPDQFVIVDKTIYLYYPVTGYGNSKMTNNFFESKLKVKATTRNWKTTKKLLELAKI